MHLLRIGRVGLSRGLIGIGAGILCGLLSGCGDSAPSPQILEAKRLLQENQSQEALDRLSSEESAEGDYLKAIALNRLGMREAARKQIAVALEKKTDVPKYRGLDLGLRLSRGNREDAESLIDLHEQNPSSAAVAFYAFYAHEALSALSLKQQDKKAAERNHQSAVQTLKTAIALHAQIPELQWEMLSFAVKFGLPDEVRQLVATLQEVAPQDPELAKFQVAALLVEKNPDEAVQVAQNFYRRNKGKQSAAVIYATALSQVEANKSRDREFHGLADQHHLNPDVLSRYAVYLTRSQRLTDAVDMLRQAIKAQPDQQARQALTKLLGTLPGRYAGTMATMEATPERDSEYEKLTEQYPHHPAILSGYAIYLARSDRFNRAMRLLEEAISKQNNPEARAVLIRVAIDLPLEIGAAEFAQQQLDRFRDQIQDPHLITYFEGRVLFLRENYQAALEKMTQVVDAQKRQQGSSRALAAEALVWMDRILAQQAVADQVQKATDVVTGGGQSDEPKAPSPTEAVDPR